MKTYVITYSTSGGWHQACHVVTETDIKEWALDGSFDRHDDLRIFEIAKEMDVDEIINQAKQTNQPPSK